MDTLRQSLMTFTEWLRFVRDFELCDASFSLRDATYVFLWSSPDPSPNSYPNLLAARRHLRLPLVASYP